MIMQTGIMRVYSINKAKQDTQYMYNVTMKHIRVTTVAVEKQ